MGKASNFNSVRETNLYFFGGGAHEKLQKTDFFRKTLTPRNLRKENFFQHRTMLKLHCCLAPCKSVTNYGAYVQTNLKMYKLWGLRWFLHQLLPLKVSTWRKKWKRHDNYAVSKKRHGHNNEFWALPLNQRGTNHVGPMLIQWRRPKLKIVAVSFFFDTAFGCKKNWKFEWTLEADNYGLKPPNLKNYNIFGILRTSPFSWYIGQTFSNKLASLGATLVRNYDSLTHWLTHWRG